jgi:hypothetical protein
MEGSDDSQLLASLRTDGSQANMIGYSAPAMMAAAPVETIFSFFSGGRGGAQARQPEAAPVEVASAPPPAPEPQPEPVRVAAVAPEPPADIPRVPQRASAAIRQPSGPVPLPPSRPFDLGDNRRAVVVVAAGASQPQHVAMPPRRPDLHASAERERAFYFSDPAARLLKLTPPDAFDRLKIKSALSED